MGKNILSLALRYYYMLATSTLSLCLKYTCPSEVESVYARPYSYTTTLNSIGLIVFINTNTAEDDINFFRKFRGFYITLRIFFPVFCKLPEVYKLPEIRFIPVERIHTHPLKQNFETHLLFDPERWNCIYSNNSKKDSLYFMLPAKREKASPHTIFLELFLYSLLQRELVSLSPLPNLTLIKLRKSTLKILQYIYYQKTGSYISIEELVKKIYTNSSGLITKGQKIYDYLFGSLGFLYKRFGCLAHVSREILLMLDEIHLKNYDLVNDSKAVTHTPSPYWMNSVLEKYINEGKRLLGEDLKLVIFQSPLYFEKILVFQLIDVNTKEDMIEDWIRFTRRYRRRFRNANISLFISTEALLTSQFYTLWSYVALEAYLIPSQYVYTPEGRFKVKEPPEEWTLYKIRESISTFEEYDLSYIISSDGNSAGLDFCNIYRVPMTKMLFHYYYYLKDKEAYLQDVRNFHADPSDILCAVCARYGDEIGIADWHPTRHQDFYPYMKKIIRLIDEMALDRLARLDKEKTEEELHSDGLLFRG